MMKLARRLPFSRPEKPTAKALLARMEDAAGKEGKPLGEWLYEALAEPFNFSGPWGAPNKAETRKKYNAAADAFAQRLAAALAGERS